MSDHNDHKDNHGSHHILSNGMIFKVGAALLILTVVTVAAARVNLGWANFPVAMLIALTKGCLVALFFMGLKYDKKENSVILVGSLLFLEIFIILTATDLLFRPTRVYDKPTPFAAAGGPPKFKKAWISQPPIVARGQELFNLQCVSCHGPNGEGNGVAAAGFQRKPRNFHSDQNWINGRKPSNVFGTLTKGVNQMPSFGSLPAEDRWALAHYVLSLGPAPAADTVADLKAAGVADPTRDDGGMPGAAPSIPIDLAIELTAVDGKK
jgi:cytochrome c oxidase subunit 4